jgi:hypothetical protein
MVYTGKLNKWQLLCLLDFLALLNVFEYCANWVKLISLFHAV